LEEVNYCLQQQSKSAERFAARFAAREALFKALSYAYPNYSFPFLTLCSRITITKIDGRPYLIVVGDIGIDLTGLVFHLSLSHTHVHATALVIIEMRSF
jgi:phosphopantetheine--protein transferase-like protein